MTGKIRTLTDKGFGFIRLGNDRDGDHFFHCRDCGEGTFDALQVGDTVEFESILEEKGLRARGVRLVSAPAN